MLSETQMGTHKNKHIHFSSVFFFSYIYFPKVLFQKLYSKRFYQPFHMTY
mgnify:CR=1 FL=1